MITQIPRKSIIDFISFIIIVSTLIIYAKEDGIVRRTLKNRKGCTCHGEYPSSDVKVTILGPDTLTVGKSAIYSVTISGGPLKAAGTNIADSDGELSPISSDLKKIKDELTHTSPKYSSSGKVLFQFSYTAPKIASNQSLYASGNSVDKNGRKTGDSWNHALTKTIVIVNEK